jgi:hypothetical protein
MPTDVAEVGQLMVLGIALESGSFLMAAQPASDAATITIVALFSTYTASAAA